MCGYCVSMDPAIGVAAGAVAFLVAAVVAARILDPDRRPSELSPEDSRARRNQRIAAAAAFVFVLGTFTWRSRTAAQLSDSPLDTAATVRVAADMLALGLAAVVLLQKQPQRTRGFSPALVFAFYIGAVALSAVAAVAPRLVAFRVFDLAVCLLVAVAVTRSHSFDQVVTLVVRILYVLVGSLVVSAAVAPALAFPESSGLLPFRLEGVYPSLAANSVGLIGVLLFCVGLADGRRVAFGLGVALVLLSQYRTGYAAVGAALVVYLLASGRISKRVAAVIAVPGAVVLVRSDFFHDVWARGEIASRSAETLSGRLEFWSAAVDVAARSPWIGTGLTSGTRYEVLARIGHDTTSTIHSTWVEIYVGTGYLGVLAAGLFVARAAWVSGRARHLTLVPLTVLAGVVVRSVTGTSFELASLPALVVLLFSIGAWRLTAAPSSVTRPDQDGDAALSGVRAQLR